MKGVRAAAVLVALLAAGGSSSAFSQQPGYSGHGAESVPASVVAKYAAPPLDGAVSRRIQTMLDVRSPGLGIVSPDGSSLYFGWRITGTSQVFRLNAPKAFPVQMTGGEDRTSIDAVTPDGKWLVLSRDVGGQENPGLYLQPAGGGALKTVQKTEKVQTFLDFVSEDGKDLYFHANDVAADSYAIYRYDLASGTKTLVFGEKGLWAVADHAGTGAGLRLLLVKATGSFSTEYAEYVPATKAFTPLLGAGEATEWDAAYAAQPDELLVRTNKFSDFRRLYRWKKGGDATAKSFVEVLAPAGMDVAGFSIDLPRRHVYASLNDGGYSRLKVLDAKTFAPVDLPLPKDADQVYAGSATPDGRFVTIGVETAQAPRTSYVWDWEKKILTQWVLPSAPEVDLPAFVSAKLMTYPAKDGTKIPMFVRFPKGCAPGENAAQDPCPVIVEFHGGPEAQATPGFSPYAQMFVDAGFVYVEPNVRGSDGYGKTWLDADNGPKRLDVISDIDDAGKWIRANWGRNGKAPKVGVTGGSYGGYATLVAMTMFAGTYDAGAAEVGISNLETFLRNTAPYRRILRISEYGDPDKDADALKKLSPVTYLDRVKAPLLVIQGVNDPRVPAGEAIQVHDLLEKRGIPAPLILFADEGHGASKRANQVLSMGHVIRFFEQNLKGTK
ncbi:MAG: S9 family peptidase [Acidobacteria bacterium]|nr:S9 family peptidase [Acidobacteriota bacterium]